MIKENPEQKFNRKLTCFAVQLPQQCEAEIKKAIDHVKDCKRKNHDDRWFRKMWYISQARDRRKRAKEAAAKSRRFAIK